MNQTLPNPRRLTNEQAAFVNRALTEAAERTRRHLDALAEQIEGSGDPNAAKDVRSRSVASIANDLFSSELQRIIEGAGLTGIRATRIHSVVHIIVDDWLVARTKGVRASRRVSWSRTARQRAFMNQECLPEFPQTELNAVIGLELDGWDLCSPALYLAGREATAVIDLAVGSDLVASLELAKPKAPTIVARDALEGLTSSRAHQRA